MKPIFRVAITIALSFLAIAVMLIGHSDTTQPELFQYLGLCDGQPCYLGVAPGKTSWADAVAIFEDTPSMGFDPDTNIASNPAGFSGSVLIFASEQGETVNQIELSMRSPRISIGSLILQMGSPCAFIFTIDGIFALFYPGMSIQVSIDDGTDQPVKPTSLSYFITLSNGNGLNSCDVLPKGYGFQRWKGFARYTN